MEIRLEKIESFNCSNCDNYKEIQHSLQFFQNISNEITDKKPLIKLLDKIIASSKVMVNAEACTLYLFDNNDKRLYFHTVSGPKNVKIGKQSVAMGEGIAGWVGKNKKPLKIDDCYSDSRFNQDFDKKSGFITKNMLCVPMMKKNQLIGVIQLMNKIGEETFSEVDVNFANMLASQCAVAIENARLVEIEIKDEILKQELQTARNIQQNIIPKNLPSYNDLEISVKLIPAKEIGGDYYNVIKISENKTLIFVADVAGKSISAALIVSSIFSFFQTYLVLNNDSFNLVDFVGSLNKFLIKATTVDKFATAWIGLYNHNAVEIEYINAGHNPTYLVRDEEIIELMEGGMLLGSIDLPYKSETHKLKKNDKIIFYTDGVTEAMNLKNEEYGEEEFQKVIRKNKKADSVQLVIEVINEIKKFTGSAEQSDDITCGVIRVL